MAIRHKAQPLQARAPKRSKKWSMLQNILLWHGNERTRKLRYLATFGLPIIAIWIAVGAYVKFAPESYTSEMTLILPGSSSSSSVSLENIGQTSTSSGSVFNSSSMSPKVIYKSIAESSRVRGLAAQKLKLADGMVQKPRIQLIDETALMIFQMTAPTAKGAQEQADALLQAMQDQLNTLRRNEADSRAAAIRNSLGDVEANLRKARARLLNFQKFTGIATVDQFRRMTDNIETLRQARIQLTADLERARTEVASFASILGITPDDAALALKVQGDPRYAAIATELATALTEDSANRSKWGPNHPKVKASSARYGAAKSQILSMSTKLLGKRGKHIVEHLLLTDSRDRSELFRKIVETQAQANGLENKLKALNEQAQMEADLLDKTAHDAAMFEDLERDHRIAETVFSSAVARVDTNRQDPYASYPLVQVLAAPNLPTEPSSPKILYAIGGGILATVMFLISFVLAWIRQPILRKILKSV